MALPSCTRRLCPTATTCPSTTSAAPIGTPPSSRPRRASSRAGASSSACNDVVMGGLLEKKGSGPAVGGQVRARVAHPAAADRQRGDDHEVGQRDEQLVGDRAERR